MTYKLRYTPGDPIAVAQVSWVACVDEAADLIAEIEEATTAHGDQRLLIDLLDVVGTFGEHDQELIGQLAALQLCHLQKVASLVHPDKITRVSERSATTLGARLRVFTSISDAIAWLMSDRHERPPAEPGISP